MVSSLGKFDFLFEGHFNLEKEDYKTYFFRFDIKFSWNNYMCVTMLVKFTSQFKTTQKASFQVGLYLNLHYLGLRVVGCAQPNKTTFTQRNLIILKFGINLKHPLNLGPESANTEINLFQYTFSSL